eukprot:scaffold71655_cov46-Phaeocystis_antarctica.AAC.3
MGACKSRLGGQLGGRRLVEHPRGDGPQPGRGEAGQALFALDRPAHRVALALRVLVAHATRGDDHLRRGGHHGQRERDRAGRLELHGKHPRLRRQDLVAARVERTHVAVVADADQHHVEARQPTRRARQPVLGQRLQLGLVRRRLLHRVSGTVHYDRFAAYPASEEQLAGLGVGRQLSVVHGHRLVVDVGQSALVRPRRLAALEHLQNGAARNGQREVTALTDCLRCRQVHLGQHRLAHRVRVGLDLDERGVGRRHHPGHADGVAPRRRRGRQQQAFGRREEESQHFCNSART